MALTLVEGEKYSRTEIDKVVIDRLVKDSEILAHLKFVEILGNSLTYDTVTTAATANFYDVGDTWAEDTHVLTQATAKLKILGGDADVDNFLKATRSNIIDVKANVLEQKIVAVQRKFLDTFYYGDDSSNTKEFDGLHLKIADTTYNTVENASGGTSQTGSIKELRQTIDLITGFKPDLMVMSKTCRTDISAYLDSIGDKFPTERTKWGYPAQFFWGVPIAVDDHLSNVEDYAAGTTYDARTGGDGYTVFVLTFEEDAVCGVQGPNSVETIKLGDLETKDADRTRIRWYCSLMFQNIRSSAKYSGVIAGTTWGA